MYRKREVLFYKKKHAISFDRSSNVTENIVLPFLNRVFFHLRSFWCCVFWVTLRCSISCVMLTEFTLRWYIYIYLSVDCVHNIVLFVLVLICSNYQNMEAKKNLVINWRQQLLVVLNGSSLHEQWRMVLLVHWNVSCSFLHNHIFCDWLVSTVQWMLSRSSNWIIAIEDFPKRHLHVQS